MACSGFLNSNFGFINLCFHGFVTTLTQLLKTSLATIPIPQMFLIEGCLAVLTLERYAFKPTDSYPIRLSVRITNGSSTNPILQYRHSCSGKEKIRVF